MRIAVYCSARPHIPSCYHDDAVAFGKWMGENGHTLVYGGLRYSMMRDVAQAAADAGGKVMGIVPESRIADQHPANTVSLLVPDLHQRKQMMEENADVFVALEGGIGTLDEVFSALASSTFSSSRRRYTCSTATACMPLCSSSSRIWSRRGSPLPRRRRCSASTLTWNR